MSQEEEKAAETPASVPLAITAKVEPSWEKMPCPQWARARIRLLEAANSQLAKELEAANNDLAELLEDEVGDDDDLLAPPTRVARVEGLPVRSRIAARWGRYMVGKAPSPNIFLPDDATLYFGDYFATGKDREAESWLTVRMDAIYGRGVGASFAPVGHCLVVGSSGRLIMTPSSSNQVELRTAPFGDRS